MNKKILYEVPEKREQSVKHFRLENKEMVAAIYPSPVHFLEDGQWKDIDNCLEEVEKGGKMGYENRSSSIKVRFAKEVGDGELVTVKKDGMNLSWKMQIPEEGKDSQIVGTRTVSKKSPFRKVTKSKKEDFPDFPKKAILSNWSSEGYYDEILPGVDLQYVLQGERMKENIHMKTKEAAEQELIFQYAHPGMVMRKENDGSLALYPEHKSQGKEEAIFNLAKPYMYDAEGSISFDVELMAECNKDKSIVKVVPGRGWLEDESRKFPVIIDPMVETAKTRGNIEDTFIFSGGSATLDQSTAYLLGTFVVGWSSSYGKCRAMLRFKNLPDIGKGSIIYAARMFLWERRYSTYGTTSFPVMAYEVTEPWTVQGVSWNQTRNKIADQVLDCNTIANQASGTITQIGFDVTRLVRQWYLDGKNYGIMVKSGYEDPSATSQRANAECYSSDNPNISSDQFPSGMFYYRNVSGLEEYQSYHEQPAGRAGCGYTNDYLGNLVWVHPDTATAGGPLPADIRHVYNLSESGNASRVGKGWRLSCMQELRASGITDYPYVYIDEDGTKHYFYKDTSDGNKLKDEDGLGLVITSTSTMTMETKDKVRYIFGTDGYLRTIQDPDGNRITYTYGSNSSGNYLDCVIDSTGQVLKLIYTVDASKSRLTAIQDSAGRSISYSYDTAGNLTGITYPDGEHSTFTYDATSKLASATSPENYSVHYTYALDFGVPRVSRITEKGADGNLGQEIAISYVNGNTTIFEEPGQDGQLGLTEDNKKITYHFDNMGRPTSIQDSDGFANNYEYYTSGMKNNKLSKDGAVQKTVYGLLKNHCFLRDGDWYTYRLADGQKGTVTRAEGCFGLKSGKLTKTDASSQEGICQDVKLNPGTYTLSAYVKTETLVPAEGQEGAALMLLKSDGSENTSERTIAYTTDARIEDGWERLSLTFSLEAEETVTVFAGMKGMTGTLYVTGVQLEEGSTANRLNLVENPLFHYKTEGVPDQWVYSANAPGAGIVTDEQGRVYARLGGIRNSCVYLAQTIDVSGQEGDVYHLSAWVNALAIPGKPFTIFGRVNYEDGTMEYHRFSCNPDIDGWQYASGTFCVGNADAESKRKYVSVKIHAEWCEQCNDLLISGMQLVKSDGGSYQYNEKGEMVSAASVAERSSFSYESSGNLTRMGNIDGTQFDYGYDEKRHLVRAASSEGVRYLFEYNAKGQPVSMRAEGGSHLDAATPGRVYYIREKVSANYLTVSGNGTADGCGIVLNDFVGTDVQKWKVKDCGGGYIQLEPQTARGKHLDLKNGSTENYAAVQILTAANTDAQKWKLLPRPDGSYQIGSKSTGDTKGLSNAGSVKTAGHAVQNALIGETYKNQCWFFEPADEGSVSAEPADGKVVAVRARHSGKYVSVKGGASAAGTLAVQLYYTGAKYQQFRMKKASEGYFYLEPLHAPGMVLCAGTTDITLQPLNESNTLQQFVFYELTGGNGHWMATKGNSFPIGIENQSYEDDAKVRPSSQAETVNHHKQFIIEELTDRIESPMTYTEDERHVSSVTDAGGNTVRYEYDEEKNRLLTAVVDGNGNRTSYTYDPNDDRLVEVKKNVGGEERSVQYTYDKDHLASIQHNGFSYHFDQDVYGNRKSVSVGDQKLIETTYRDYNGLVDAVQYGTGEKIINEYDDQEQLISQYLKVDSETEEKLYTNTYDNYGNILRHVDERSQIKTDCQYDLIGRVVGTDSSDGLTLRNQYDDKNRVKAVVQKVDDSLLHTEFLYGDPAKSQKPGLFYGLKVDGEERASYSYDPLARQTEKCVHYGAGEDDNYVTAYQYHKGSEEGTTTTLLAAMSNGADTVSYTYDANGNIKTIKENGIEKCEYYYDELNSLIREDNVWENKTICYTYDQGGNLTSRKEYAYTKDEVLAESTLTDQKDYTYRADGWKDQLLSYDRQTITYDAIGNPLTYRGMDFQWEMGRQLKKVIKNGKEITFAYDSSGNRIKKTIRGVETRYFLSGSQIIAMKKGNELIHFIYDEKGNPFAMKVNNETYYYIYNGQNDVIGLIDSSGEQMVTYRYNSWGLPLGVEDDTDAGIGAKNPFRYRGYCYDEETGSYYVSSRYYDPEIGRFINPDTLDILGVDNDLHDKNLYAYCDNNPVMRKDSDGELWIATVAVGVVTQYAGDVLGNLIAGKSGADLFKPTSSIGEYVAAGVTAFIPGTGIAGSLARNVTSEAIISVERRVTGKSNNLRFFVTNIVRGTLLDTGIEAASNRVTKYVRSKTSKTYSQQANKVRKKKPNASTSTIRKSAQRSVRWGNRITKGIGFVVSSIRSALPW